MDDLEGTQHAVGLRIHDLATIYNAFTCLHHSLRQRNTVDNISLHLIGSLFVIRNVFHQIVIDVTTLQDTGVQASGAIVDDEFVSRFDGEEFTAEFGGGNIVLDQ